MASPNNNNNRGNAKPRIATLSDLRNDNNNNKNAAQGSDKGQNFYTGGGSSGLEVEGPRRNSNLSSNPNELVSSLFESARKQGARTTEDYEREQREASKSDKYFGGNAYKLGDSTTSNSQHFHAPSTQSSPPPPPPLITVSFWQNGFTVDNGELRGYDDPKNQSFLQDINNGIAPEELVRGRRNDIEIRLENKHDQPYAPPPVVKPKIVPFSGTGFSLGSDPSPSPSPSPVHSNPPSAINNNNSNQSPSLPSTQPPSSTDNEKTTRIQIQFHDGTKVAQQFPVSTTILQIRQFVENQKPTGREFQLMTTYPRLVLENDSLTLVDANLLNSMIVQKFVV